MLRRSRALTAFTAVLLTAAVAAQTSQHAADLEAADPGIRAAAACELGRSGSQAASFVPKLVALLADLNSVAAVNCGMGIWLRDIVQREGFGTQTTTPGAEAAQALARIGPPGIAALMESTKSTDWRVRHNAVYGLGGVRRAVETAPIADRAIALLRDEHPQVRRAAARAVGELDDRRAVRPLIAVATDADWDVRQAVAWALGEIDDPEAVPQVVGMLRDQSPAVRETAAWALGELDRGEAVQPLVATLTDQDERVRKNAAWALGEIRNPAALDGLITALKDQAPAVRRTAAWALSEIRDRRAVEPVAALLGDRDWRVRQQAAHALGELHDSRAVGALSQALKDDHAQVRRTAAWALGEIKD